MAARVYGALGSVSSGTMRAEDLVPTFADILGCLARRAGRFREYEPTLKIAATATSTDAHVLEDVLDELFDALHEFAPPYCYFGAHPGDGADYGFWTLDPEDFEEAIHCGELLKVSDTSEIPKGYSGYVLQVNDHGNQTLYNCVRGRKYEIWSIV